tara:strand:+ start:2267 stop:2689 length:423 start_codon:yes stop_codon:yes gene_type:complete
MAKKSKVNFVTSTGTWKNKEGKIFYKYRVRMANGDEGEYSSISETQNKFIIDQESEYIYSEGDHPKIKPFYSNPIGGNYNIPSNTDEQIARSVGLKAATDLGIAQGLELAEILETAKIMADFIIKDKQVELRADNETRPF